MVTGVDCGNGAWACAHRSQAVLGMVGWAQARESDAFASTA